MATYYVDYASGNDANAGTSTGAPWKHAPGDASATGLVPSAVSAGDVVLFHGGITYAFGSGLNDFISLSASGTSGSPITYRSGHLASPQWGTTPAVIDGTNCGTAEGAIVIGIVGHILIDGLSVTGVPNTAGGSDPTYAGLISIPGVCLGNITIQNCVLTNTAACGVFIQGLFGAGTNPSGFVINNCTFDTIGEHGVFPRGGVDNITISNNTFTFTTLDNICLYFFDEDVDSMNNVTISGNTFGSSSNKGPILVEVTVTGLTITGNTVTGSFNGWTLVALNGKVTNSLIANNLIYGTNSSFEGVFRSFPDIGPAVASYTNMVIANNTIYYLMPFGAPFYFTPGNTTGAVLFTNLTVKNNIVIANPAGSGTPLMQINENSSSTGLVVDMATFECDYNVWNPLSPAAGDGFQIGGVGESGSGSTNYTFSGWQTFSGKDTHSTTSVPVFDASTFIPAVSDTVARGKGVDLTSAGITTDIRGNTRTVPWTIGCYQDSAAISPSLSTAAASPTSVAADGVTTSTITVTLLNGSSSPVSGKTVSLAHTSGTGAPTISAASGPSSAEGRVTFTVKSSTAASDTFTATDTTDSVTITQTATVTFTTIVSIPCYGSDKIELRLAVHGHKSIPVVQALATGRPLKFTVPAASDTPNIPVYAPDRVERDLVAQPGQSIPVAQAISATRPVKFTVPV